MYRICATVAFFGLFGCAGGSDLPHSISEIGGLERTTELPEKVYLFTAETAIQDEWAHMAFRGATDYRLVVFNDEIAIRAQGRHSASGLIRDVHLDPRLCPEIEWAWSVTTLQSGVNLHDRAREDVGASLFLLFGDPGFSSAPNPVPTLRYVWSSHLIEGEQAEIGEVIDSPFMPGLVKSIVVERGLSDKSRWTLERRNIREDFERAFGRPPDEPVQAIALFSDNDQTGEPVEAYYGWARAHCKAGGGETDAAYSWE